MPLIHHRDHDGRRLHILEALARSGVVRCILYNDDYSHWQLLQDAVDHVTMSICLEQPRFVFMPRPDLACIEDGSRLATFIIIVLHNSLIVHASQTDSVSVFYISCS